jgi:hypothetical protein
MKLVALAMISTHRTVTRGAMSHERLNVPRNGTRKITIAAPDR